MKLQNSKANRKALIDDGFTIHDPHGTFSRKAWIIKARGINKLLLGVNKRNSFKEVSIEEFLK